MCLKEASIQQFSTIAIPALGTGNLGFPRDVVARTILTTVSRFPQKFPNTSLKEVRVVLFKDPETMRVDVTTFSKERIMTMMTMIMIDD